MAYFEYKIEVVDKAKRDVTIALLSDIGMTGFEETDDLLVGFSRHDIPEEELHSIFQLVELTYSKSIIEEKNWNALWESDFKPISVRAAGSQETFAFVRAHFHPAPESAQYDLIITPKMSFGTGHHATTYGMMSYMSTIIFKDLSVVDFGTGTGLLAILADKMGAAKVLATDNDPGCISNAAENIKVNQCRHVELKESDLFESPQQPDVILANINLNIIKENLPLIKATCHEATIILLSGILVQDAEDILTSLHAVDIYETDVINNEGWLIIAAKSGRQIASLRTGS